MKKFNLKKSIAAILLTGTVITGTTAMVYNGEVQAYATETIVQKGSVATNSGVTTSVPYEERDIWSFDIDETGVLLVTTAWDSEYNGDIDIVDANGAVLSEDMGNWYTNNLTGKRELSMPLQLTPGTYYMRVYNHNDENYILASTVTLKFTPIQKVTSNSNVSDTLSRNEVRLYSLSLSSNNYIELKGSFPTATYQDIQILNADGDIIDKDSIVDGDWTDNSMTGQSDLDFKTSVLVPGTYYIKVINKTEGNLSYNINISGEASTPDAPSAPILSIRSIGKNNIKVSYNKPATASKFIFSYRKKGSSKWKNKTTTKTNINLKGLKRKTSYEMRVRAIRTVSGKNYKGAWSNVMVSRTK